jgi:hypothetical protein
MPRFNIALLKQLKINAQLQGIGGCYCKQLPTTVPTARHEQIITRQISTDDNHKTGRI